MANSTATTYGADAVLMAKMDSGNLSTSFIDSSYTTTKTITANLGAIQSTAQSKFGISVGLFVSATDSYLTIPDSADWDYGTGDFTIDFWARMIFVIAFCYFLYAFIAKLFGYHFWPF